MYLYLQHAARFSFRFSLLFSFLGVFVFASSLCASVNVILLGAYGNLAKKYLWKAFYDLNNVLTYRSYVLGRMLFSH